jgi:hypothetical protein
MYEWNKLQRHEKEEMLASLMAPLRYEQATMDTLIAYGDNAHYRG